MSTNDKVFLTAPKSLKHERRNRDASGEEEREKIEEGQHHSKLIAYGVTQALPQQEMRYLELSLTFESGRVKNLSSRKLSRVGPIW